jgi:hypothetical protein
MLMLPPDWCDWLLHTQPRPKFEQSESMLQVTAQNGPSCDEARHAEPVGQSLSVVQETVHMPPPKVSLVMHRWSQSRSVAHAPPTTLLVELAAPPQAASIKMRKPE